MNTETEIVLIHEQLQEMDKKIDRIYNVLIGDDQMKIEASCKQGSEARQVHSEPTSSSRSIEWYCNRRCHWWVNRSVHCQSFMKEWLVSMLSNCSKRFK